MLLQQTFNRLDFWFAEIWIRIWISIGVLLKLKYIELNEVIFLQDKRYYMKKIFLQQFLMR